MVRARPSSRSTPESHPHPQRLRNLRHQGRAAFEPRSASILACCFRATESARFRLHATITLRRRHASSDASCFCASISRSSWNTSPMKGGNAATVGPTKGLVHIKVTVIFTPRLRACGP